MIIKDDVKLTIDNQYLNIEYDKMFAKKITSSQYPDLIGLSDFNGKGEKTMHLLNLLEKEDIDPYWLFRGDIAESLAYEAIKTNFENRFGKENVEVLLFHSKDYTYGDQWHYDKATGKGNQFFGGRLDIGIKVTNPKTKEVKRWVVEVKGKTYETMYDKIVGTNLVKGEPPATEVEQGKFLATMMTLNAVTMGWVFFTKEQELMLRKMHEEGKPFNGEIGVKDVKMHFQLFEFDRDEFVRDMTVASNGLRLCAKEKRIPLFTFNDKEMKIINEHIENHYKREQAILAEQQRIENVMKENEAQVDEDKPFDDSSLPF